MKSGQCFVQNVESVDGQLIRWSRISCFIAVNFLESNLKLMGSTFNNQYHLYTISAIGDFNRTLVDSQSTIPTRSKSFAIKRAAILHQRSESDLGKSTSWQRRKLCLSGWAVKHPIKVQFHNFTWIKNVPRQSEPRRLPRTILTFYLESLVSRSLCFYFPRRTVYDSFSGSKLFDF